MRILLEFVATAALACVAFFSFWILMLTPWWVWAVGAVPYVALWVMRRRGIDLERRTWIDCGLAALVPAAGLTMWAIQARWPLSGRRWDAHGWGRSGGEDNWLFLPWTHVLLWVALAWVLRERRDRRADARERE